MAKETKKPKKYSVEVTADGKTVWASENATMTAIMAVLVLCRKKDYDNILIVIESNEEDLEQTNG